MATLKLTEKTVSALPPASSAVQDYYWDTDLTGFGVVVGRTGQKTFVARAWVGEKNRRVKLGVAGEARADGHLWTASLARIEAKKMLGAMADGRDPNAERRGPQGGPTLRDGLELHVANMRREGCSARSIHVIESEVKRHLEGWLDRPIAALTALELERVREGIEKNTKPRRGSVNRPGTAQANKTLSHVSAIWNTLDTLHDLPGKNPAMKLTKTTLKPRALRIPDDGFADWYARVMALSPVRRDFQLVTLFTGVRSDGVRNVTIADIDFARGFLHIARAKGDRPYTVPLTRTVALVLQGRLLDNPTRFAPNGGAGDWVFPTVSRDMKRVQPMAEAREEGLPGPHANRRTFNSVALETGIPLEPRETLMNHSGKGVNVRHYGLPERWDYLRECAERIEAALWERIGLTPPQRQLAPPA